jgi:hypothetical protein
MLNTSFLFQKIEEAKKKITETEISIETHNATQGRLYLLK